MPHGPLVSCPIIFYRFSVPSSASSDRTGGSVISTLEEKDSYDVGGAKSDGHGGAESSCQKQFFICWTFKCQIQSHITDCSAPFFPANAFEITPKTRFSRLWPAPG